MPTANRPLSEKAIPWHVTNLQDNNQLNSAIPIVGDKLLLTPLSTLIEGGFYNYEDSQTSPTSLSCEVSDSFVIDRIKLKSNILARLNLE